MASLRLAIKASLEQSQAVAASAASPEPEAPSKAIKQDKALPAAKSSPTAPQRKRGKEASTPVAPPPKRSKPKANAAPKAAKAAAGATAHGQRSAAAGRAAQAEPARGRAGAAQARQEARRKAVGDQVDALWPADGEFYQRKCGAVNAGGTIALDYADGDRRNDATTSELRRKRQATPAEADPDFAPAAPSTADAPAARSTITDKKALEERMAADGWTKEEKRARVLVMSTSTGSTPRAAGSAAPLSKWLRKAYPELLGGRRAQATKKEPSRARSPAEKDAAAASAMVARAARTSSTATARRSRREAAAPPPWRSATSSPRVGPRTQMR